MSKGQGGPIWATVSMVLAIALVVILVLFLMKIPGLGEWIVNSLKGFFGRPGTTAEELGIALNSMEALRFAIDVVANDGKVPTTMAVSVPSEEKKTFSTCNEYLAQFGNKQVNITEKMNKNGYSGEWTLEIGSFKEATVCGSTKEECGTRPDDVVIEGWCGGIMPNDDASNCNKNVGEEKQRIQCTNDNKWYWATFGAKLVKGSINLPTGNFLLTIKNKITGMVAAGENIYHGCKYTESAGKIEASCTHNSMEGKRADSVKVECSGPTGCEIIGFELPQQVDENSAQDWIMGYGDPNILGYWQRLPDGEASSWEGAIPWAEDAGVLFMAGVTAAAATCLIPGGGKLKSNVRFVVHDISAVKISAKESAEQFLKLIEKDKKIKIAAGFGVGTIAVATYLDSKSTNYNPVRNSLVLKQPGTKVYKFPLSDKANEHFVMLDKSGWAGDDVPLYFASPCKIDVKVERISKDSPKAIGCGKPDEEVLCCVNENKEPYWSIGNCSILETGYDPDFGEIPIRFDETDTTEEKCKDILNQKPIPSYFQDTGLSNYCMSPTQYLPSNKMDTIIVKDIYHDYTDKNYKNTNFCYSSRTKAGAAVMAASAITDVLVGWNPALGCGKRVGILIATTAVSTKVAQATTWPRSPLWN